MNDDISTLLRALNDCEGLLRSDEPMEALLKVNLSLLTARQRLVIIRKLCVFAQKTNTFLNIEEILSVIDGTNIEIHSYITDDGEPRPYSDEQLDFIKRWKPY